MSENPNLLPEVKEHYGRVRNYIDGDFVESTSTRFGEVVNPATAKVIAEVPMSTKEEVTAAVDAAAQRAFERAKDILIFHRKRECISKFEISLEGDNVDNLRKHLSYPYFVDLDRSCFEMLWENAKRRPPGDDFFEGFLLAASGQMEEGLMRMGMDDFPRDQLSTFKKACDIHNIT